MRLRLPATALTIAALALPASAAATTATQHLTDGQQLVTNLALTAWPGQNAINKYDSDGANSGVMWGTAGVAAGWSNDTKCARFVRELFGRAYSWATNAWFTAEFGSTSPDTEQLVANMPSADHFDLVNTVTSLQAGDLVMFDKTGTGVDHTVVVRQVTSLPGGITPQAGTVQYAVQVIDSTSNPHGYLINGTNHTYKQWADTRRLDGTRHVRDRVQRRRLRLDGAVRQQLQRLGLRLALGRQRVGDLEGLRRAHRDVRPRDRRGLTADPALGLRGERRSAGSAGRARPVPGNPPDRTATGPGRGEYRSVHAEPDHQQRPPRSCARTAAR